MHQRFKTILVITALVHAGVIFYKMGGRQLIFSTGEINKSISVRVLLEQALKKPATKPKKLVKKQTKVKKKVGRTPVPVQKEETQTQELKPSQTPEQAFDSLILAFTQPNYPRLALRRGITGVVILSLFIKSDGSMERVTVAQSSGNDLLDNSALNAAKQWKFKALGPQTAGLTVVQKRIVYKIN